MKTSDVWIVGIVLALLVAGLAPSVYAQDDEDWGVQLDIVRVIPDKFDDYIELQFKEVNPALQKAGVPWRSVLRTAQFGGSYDIHLVRPIRSLAEEYDFGDPLARVLRPDKHKRLVNRLRRMTVSRDRYALRSYPDMTVVPRTGGLYLYRMMTIQVAPGHRQEWLQFIRSRIPKDPDEDLSVVVYERMFGSGPSSWVVVENFSSFVQLEQSSFIFRARGEQVGTAAAKIAGVVTSIERTVMRVDAELSFSSTR